MERKPLLMDSGTSLFRAADFEDAVRIAGEVLQRGGGNLVRSGGVLTLDHSSLLHTKIIEATIEETSQKGIFAASFREGNCGRILRFALPSRDAVRRMNAVREELGSYQ